MTAFEEEKGKHTHGKNWKFEGNTINFYKHFVIILPVQIRWDCVMMLLTCILRSSASDHKEHSFTKDIHLTLQLVLFWFFFLLNEWFWNMHLKATFLPSQNKQKIY